MKNRKLVNFVTRKSYRVIRGPRYQTQRVHTKSTTTTEVEESESGYYYTPKPGGSDGESISSDSKLGDAPTEAAIAKVLQCTPKRRGKMAYFNTGLAKRIRLSNLVIHMHEGRGLQRACAYCGHRTTAHCSGCKVNLCFSKKSDSDVNCYYLWHNNEILVPSDGQAEEEEEMTPMMHYSVNHEDRDPAVTI